MELAEIIGYLGALLIGVVLGLIGGGGSILTVPVLVYLLGVNPVTATAYSLFVVGTSSFMGAARNLQKGRMRFRTAFSFALPALISVFCTRKYIVPAIPEQLFSIGSFTLSKGTGIMIFFALLMFLAGSSMILDRDRFLESGKNASPNYRLLIPLGFVTGLITGLVGAGGGFIIVPILVILAGLPMKKAVGTSLLIIAINSLIGFLGDLGHREIDWYFLILFSLLAVCGIFLGIFLNRFINGSKLKTGFGWFVLLMGTYVLWKELF